MKLKKLVLGSAVVLALGSLVGCGGGNGGNKDAEVDVDYKLRDPGTLREGFTSLENKHANAPLRADGTYVAGGKTFNIKDTLRTTYAAEPNRAFFNYLTNQWTINSYHYCNMVDGLVENDKYANVVGALALGYKTETFVDGQDEDGNDIIREKWTFQLRENAEWVDNKTGEFYGRVTAQDFVDGIEYVLNPANASATSGIVTSVILNSQEYFDYLTPKEEEEEPAAPAAAIKADDPEPAGDPDPAADPEPAANPVTSFEQVGVKAESKFVVSYTLYEPTPYFLSMLTYSPFLPVNANYVEKMGDSFGKTCNNILVNGAFRITTHQFETKMVYTKNYHYYDRDHVYVRHINRRYVPNTATPNTTRKWFESGAVDSFTVSSLDEQGFEKYVSGADGQGTLANPAHENCTSTQSYGTAVYIGYWNFNRSTWDYGKGSKLSDDKTSFVEKSPEQKAAAAKAIFNKDFRLGFMYGMKTLEYLKRFSKTEPANYLMRSYTNRELVSYNGKDYCDYVDDVYNEKQGTTGKSLTGIIAKEDVVFDSEKAKAHFAAAKADLIANSGMAEADFPVYVDIIQSMNAAMQPLEKAMYDAIEQASDGVLKIVYNVADNDAQDEEWGSETNNYDFSLWSGWGPDYADPKTYMHTFAMKDGDSLVYSGFLEKTVSEIYKAASGCDTVEALQEKVLGEYDALYKEAAAITDVARTEERYQKFALAEYNLIFESAIIAPWMSQSGYIASVSNTIAWQAGRASYGLTSDKFKNVVVSKDVITKEIKAALTAEYEAGKNASANAD